MLLYPLEKQLDLPPRFVYIRNRLGHPRCVVGHEHIAVLRHRILVRHSPQRRGIRLPTASAGQLDRLIAEDAGPASDVMLARDPISHAPLQARHEGHAPRLQLMEPLEVKIRAVRHDHAAGWKRPGAGDLDVTGLALGHTDEARQMARLIQPDVQLDRTKRHGRQIVRACATPLTVARRVLMPATSGELMPAHRHRGSRSGREIRGRSKRLRNP